MIFLLTIWIVSLVGLGIIVQVTLLAGLFKMLFNQWRRYR